MLSVFKRWRSLSVAACLVMAFVMVLGLGGKSYADESTREVEDASSFYRALVDSYVTHIVVTKSFDANCLTAELGVTSRFTLNRNLLIEGKGSGITIRRVIDEDAKNGDLQSLFWVKGNGYFGDVTVTFSNITLDGGANFGSYSGYDRVTHYNEITKLGAAGRSLIDVCNNGTLVLKKGVTIKNCYCTNSMTALNSDETSGCYGAAVRVEFASKSDAFGGTVEINDGVTIKDCVASNKKGDSYGGAVGAFTNGKINMYGGTIQGCSAQNGGAIGCTYSRGDRNFAKSPAVFVIKGGTIKNCSAYDGGAIYADGNSVNDSNYLQGGTIDGCQAQSAGKGSALALGAGPSGSYTKLYLADHDEDDGPLFIKNCKGSTKYTSPSATYNGKALEYKWLYLGDGNKNVIIEASTKVKLTLDKYEANIVCGKTLTLNATLKNATSSITWKSTDPKIASVDAVGKITARMAGTTTITATAAGKTAKCSVTVQYKDVKNTKDFWYEPTYYLTDKGVAKGYANQTEFRPANDCTRAQMVTFLYRLQGEPKTKSNTCKFKDVRSTDYFYKPVIWALEKGITTGVSKEKFDPQGVCTRAQTVTFLWRMANKPEPNTTKNPFNDVKKSDYFYKATLWASEKKILAGYDDNTFRPKGKCLRRQMVTFLYKYDKYINGKG